MNTDNRLHAMFLCRIALDIGCLIVVFLLFTFLPKWAHADTGSVETKGVGQSLTTSDVPSGFHSEITGYSSTAANPAFFTSIPLTGGGPILSSTPWVENTALNTQEQQVGNSSDQWSTLSGSSDGTRLIVTNDGSNDAEYAYYYTSSDSGTTWTQHAPTNVPRSGGLWVDFTSSSNGMTIYGDWHTGTGNDSGNIWVSTDGGSTWTAGVVAGSATQVSIRHGDFKFASSADGTHAIAAAESNSGGVMYTTADSGATWTQHILVGANLDPDWMAVTSSSDGTKLAAIGTFFSGSVPQSSYIYTSTNSGTNWTQHTISGALADGFTSIASSVNGTDIVVGDLGPYQDNNNCTSGYNTGGYIYISTNGGTNWTQETAAGQRVWSSVTMSSDGTRISGAENKNYVNGNCYAVTSGGYIYNSLDTGSTWTQLPLTGQRAWVSLFSSSDGTELVATDNGATSDEAGNGGIYITKGSTVVTVSATDFNSSGYTTKAGSCTYPQGGTECSVNAFTITPTCNGSWCSLSTSTIGSLVTKVAFRYLGTPTASLEIKGVGTNGYTTSAPAGFQSANGVATSSTNPNTYTITPSITPPSDSLLSWWTLNEGTGSIAVDGSSNGNTGTLNGNPIWTAGGALYFNGNGSNYVLASDAGFPTGTSPRTVSLWINGTGTNETYFTGYGDGYDGYQRYDIGMIGGRATVETNGAGVSATTGPLINDGNWHNVIATFDGTTHYIYVDGQLVGSGTVPTDTSLSGSLMIGRNTGGYLNGYPFLGTIDEVRYYSRALSPTEAYDIYEGSIIPVTAYATNAANTTAAVGTCSYAVGDPECSVTSFPITPICSGAWCYATTSTEVGQVTKVAFQYTPVSVSTTGCYSATPDIFSNTVSWLNNSTVFPAGKYAIIYQTGAMKINPSYGYSIWGYWAVDSTNNTFYAPFNYPAPPQSGSFPSTQTALIVAASGSSTTFTINSPSKLGLELLDSPYSDNVHGTPYQDPTFEICPTSSTGDVEIKDVGADLTTASAPPSTHSFISNFATTTANPSYFTNVVATSSTSVYAYASNISGYTTTVASCTYPRGSSECTVNNSNFSAPTLGSGNNWYYNLQPVTDNNVTLVFFRYIANQQPTQPLSVSCSATPPNPIVGQSVTWSATVTPSGTYTYSWILTDGSTDYTGTNPTITYTYTSAGTKVGTVTVTSADGTMSGSCSRTITVGSNNTFIEF